MAESGKWSYIAGGLYNKRINKRTNALESCIIRQVACRDLIIQGSLYCLSCLQPDHMTPTSDDAMSLFWPARLKDV